MISLLKDFLLNPPIKSGIKKLSIKNFLFLFVVELVVLLFFTIINDYFFGSYSNKFMDNIEEIYENVVLLIIIGAILFPVFEEFLHRYYLDYKSKSLLISAVLLLIYFLLTFDQQNLVQTVVHFFCFLFVTTFFLLKRFFDVVNIRILVWGSILFFGLFHTSNYESDIYLNNYFIIPILVMPQFIGGFFQAFIRIHYRFIYCVLYHGFFNLIIFTSGFIEYTFFR